MPKRKRPPCVKCGGPTQKGQTRQGHCNACYLEGRRQGRIEPKVTVDLGPDPRLLQVLLPGEMHQRWAEHCRGLGEKSAPRLRWLIEQDMAKRTATQAA